MRTGRPRATVTLTADERQQLDSLAHRSRSAPDVARRARIILACAEGRETTAVARRLHVSATTVCKWRSRFLEERLDGLFDEPRPGTPRTITDDQIEQIVIRTLETTPRGATHWSVRDMAKASGISPRRSIASGARSACNRIAARRSSCRPTPCSSRKSATSSGCTWIRPITPWSCASTKSRRSRRWIGPNRCCRCVRARRSGARTITNGMARRRCSPPSTSKRAG